MSVANPSVPVVISTGLICLVLGAGVGSVAAVWYAPTFGKEQREPDSPEKMGKGGDAAPMADVAGGMGKGGMGKGKGKGKGGFGKGKGGQGKGGFAAPSPKRQLASLVTKLDQLTEKPLTIKLSDEQKAKIAEQLAGLDKAEDLADGDAKMRMDAILDVVKGDRAVLEAAGFIWPGGGMRTPPQDSPNPFSSEENANRLKALQARTAKPKS
jgi:gas vesicle protein